MTTDAFLTRQTLSHFQQMQDAQNQCVPCKLCGGSAIISDAGPGAGYYIRCKNSGAFRANDGCMVDDLRLSGWAYNVMEWWNRLHAHPPIQAAESGLLEEAVENRHHINGLIADIREATDLHDENCEVIFKICDKLEIAIASYLPSPSGLMEGMVRDLARDLARYPCETIGLEDMEAGCCGPCRARALLAKAGKPGEAGNG